MIIELDKEYFINNESIQIQVGGDGSVNIEVSQDGLDFVIVKSIASGDVPKLFELKQCMLKFTSSDAVQVSVVPNGNLGVVL